MQEVDFEYKGDEEIVDDNEEDSSEEEEIPVDSVVVVLSDGFDAALDTVSLWIDLTDGVPISTELFGVNNDWSKITAANYSAFSQGCENIGYQQLRFPGGWESEYYDWINNSTDSWDRSPAVAGADISSVNATSPPTLSIVIPTREAMNEVLMSAAWEEAISSCIKTAIEAINTTGAVNVKIIEIGNEWWLQWGGGVSRADKNLKYAYTAKRIANHIRTTFPDAAFRLLVNGDYTQPQEFRIIKDVFASDIEKIDGLALHPYAGYQSATHAIDSLQSFISKCKENLGRDYMSLSEWAPSKDYNEGRVYAQSAGVLVGLFHEFARSGANAAAYWPPVNQSIAGLGLFNTNFMKVWPNGQLFADMAADYQGVSLNTCNNANLKVIAARNDNGRVVVYVVGDNSPHTRVELHVQGADIVNTVSTKLFSPFDPQNTKLASAMTVTESPDYAVSASFEGFVFYANENSAYTIYKLVFEI